MFAKNYNHQKPMSNYEAVRFYQPKRRRIFNPIKPMTVPFSILRAWSKRLVIQHGNQPIRPTWRRSS